jgi:hypothetical protein
MTDADRCKLLPDPYHPARCRVGKQLFDELKGD